MIPSDQSKIFQENSPYGALADFFVFFFFLFSSIYRLLFPSSVFSVAFLVPFLFSR